ncbi:MAG TPA: sugar ABC transporter permease, partial [Chloroflexota bacterium]|nr:sugar ABC transporter permease [Chloroflexota bacterium]
MVWSRRWARMIWERTRAQLLRGELGRLPVVVGLALIWGYFQTQNNNFLTARNLSNLIMQIGVLGTLAVGIVLVLLLGEIDLSIAAVSGVCAGIFGLLLTNHGWNAWAAIALTLAVGALIGLIQGAWVVYVGVPSFIVTLAGLLAWQGVLLALLGNEGELLITNATVRSIASSYFSPLWGWLLGVGALAVYLALLWSRWVSRRRHSLEPPSVPMLVVRSAIATLIAVVVVATLNSYFGVPYVLAILLALTAFFALMLNKTAFGRHVYAIGGNAEAARRAGIHVGRVRVAIFTIASTLGAFGGILGASREFAVSTGTGGGTLLLDAIAAAVIGGTSLFGGRGFISSALLGALVIGSVENGLDLLGQSSSTKDVATGII